MNIARRREKAFHPLQHKQSWLSSISMHPQPLQHVITLCKFFGFPLSCFSSSPLSLSLLCRCSSPLLSFLPLPLYCLPRPSFLPLSFVFPPCSPPIVSLDLRPSPLFYPLSVYLPTYL
uniref:Uncharacterized protein n=1 Tax=Cacopsylla melanoneura TaxID=428564 RepID=A0A8D8RKK5_9HEMI